MTGTVAHFPVPTACAIVFSNVKNKRKNENIETCFIIFLFYLKLYYFSFFLLKIYFQNVEQSQ